MSTEPENNTPPVPSGLDTGRYDASRASQDLNGMAVLWMGAQPSIAAFVWASIGNYQDAEDVVQQVATEVAEHFERYRRDSPFLPWAMSIARYRVIDYYRKHADKKVSFGSEHIDHLASVASGGQDSTSLDYEALEHCMASLPKKTRRLFEMRYLSDMKPQSIAERIGTTSNTVSVALSRARSQLAQCVRNRLSSVEVPR